MENTILTYKQIADVLLECRNTLEEYNQKLKEIVMQRETIEMNLSIAIGALLAHVPARDRHQAMGREWTVENE